MTRPGIEPQFPGPLANTLLTRLTVKWLQVLLFIYGQTKDSALLAGAVEYASVPLQRGKPSLSNKATCWLWVVTCDA